MKAIALILVIVTIVAAGCRLASNSTNSARHTDLQRAYAIVVTKKKVQTTISDQQTVDRIRDICANAKWKTYWHTLPENIGERSIALLDEETRLDNSITTASSGKANLILRIALPNFQRLTSSSLNLCSLKILIFRSLNYHSVF